MEKKFNILHTEKTLILFYYEFLSLLGRYRYRLAYYSTRGAIVPKNGNAFLNKEPA